MTNYIYILTEFYQNGNSLIIGAFADNDKACKEKSALEYKARNDNPKPSYFVEAMKIIK